ncbi:hypothetical protein MTO96_020618 [Rhipicephalus appendiculatus]
MCGAANTARVIDACLSARPTARAHTAAQLFAVGDSQRRRIHAAASSEKVPPTKRHAGANEDIGHAGAAGVIQLSLAARRDGRSEQLIAFRD